ELPDPDALTSLFTDVVGLTPGDPTVDGDLTWRNDDRAHRIIVRPGPANDAVFVGFEAIDDDVFDLVRQRFVDAGLDPTEGTADELAARRVRRLIHVATPLGVRLELVAGLDTAPTAFESELMPGGFLTQGVGFGHVVFGTNSLTEVHEFLTKALGMSQSDWLDVELAPEFNLEVRFYHCNPRHHTMALANVPFEPPQKLHHIMFETTTRDDVGAAFDRAWASGLAIPNGLGQHDNDEMFSFYVASPAGFQVEVGHGARTITDDWTDNRPYDRISRWGHQPLPQR
ncbi:MAG TPA: VOC family protein, partial [Ilumatobacter sp.]|nr:VOC family protein [Ilumatobacter sp.]